MRMRKHTARRVFEQKHLFCLVLRRRWQRCGGGVTFSFLSTEVMFVVVYEWMYKWVDEKVSISTVYIVISHDASFQTKSQSLAFALSIPRLKYIQMSVSVGCIDVWTQLSFDSWHLAYLACKETLCLLKK